MRSVTRRVFLAAAVLGLIGRSAQAGIIYDNSGSQFTGSIVGTRLQLGDQVTAGGTARLVTLLEIGINMQGIAGMADLQAFLYANDGSSGEPGTLLWQSNLQSQVTLTGGNDLIPFIVPSVVVPDTFTWTVQYFNASPIEPSLPVFGPASVGSSPDYAWFGGPGSWTKQTFPAPVDFLARITAVPEPSSLFLAGIAGAAGLGICVRRRRGD